MITALVDEGRRQAFQWSEAQRAEAEALVTDRPLDAIFTALAEPQMGPGALVDDLAEAGRRVYRNCRSLLCGDERLSAFADPTKADIPDKIALLAVIASLVGPRLGQDINELLVAALILRLGLRRLCGQSWGT